MKARPKEIMEKEQLDKLTSLLLSEDEANVRLGLQIMPSLKDQEQFRNLLLALALLYEYSGLEHEIILLLSKVIKKEDFKLITRYLKAFSNRDFYKEESALCHLYAQLSAFPVLDVAEISKTVLLNKGKGVKYCLENEILPVQEVLKTRIKNNELNLGSCELMSLPEEVSMFQELITLNISNNQFKELPESIQKLGKLSNIYYSHTPLSQQSLSQLEKWFPKIMAETHYSKHFLKYLEDERYEPALVWINKCLELNPDSDTFWIGKGVIQSNRGLFREGIECMDKALLISPYSLLAYSNKAIYLHDLGEEEASLKTALEGIDLYDNHPEASQKDSISTLYFSKGQALYFLKRFEESEEAYFEALKHDPNDGASQYNLACIYIIWKQQEKVIEYLNKAIANDSKYFQEAKEDKDFEPYAADDEFWSMIKAPIS